MHDMLSLKQVNVNIDNDFLINLNNLSFFLENQTNLSDCLNEAATMAAGILQMDRCSIVLTKENANSGYAKKRIFAGQNHARNSLTLESTRLDEAVARYVFQTGRTLFVESTNCSDLPFLAEIAENLDRSIIASPLKIDNQMIGIVIFCALLQERTINHEDLQRVDLIAMTIEKAIKIIQLQNLLNSRYAHWAAVETAKKRMDNPITIAVQEPEKLAKVLARTFYKEMAKAGFSSNHIVNAASEIISLLGNNLNNCKKRFHNNSIKTAAVK